MSAHREAENAVKRFSADGGEWAWKFRLLDADILIWQGRNADAIALLRGQLPSSLSNGDMGIQKRILSGIAYSRVGDLSQANQNLLEAQQLSDSSHSLLAGDVARARGVVEFSQDHLPAAKEFFQTSLAFARQHSDQFLEATALLNLGLLAIQEDHFDDAIDLTEASLRAAKHIDARQLQQKAAGNLAWTYYKVGDFEKSIAVFREAEQSAASLGLVMDQIEWLSTLGVLYAEANQQSPAETNYKRALTLAQQLDSKQQIVGITTALALLAVDAGKLDEAEQLNRSANSMAKAEGNRSDELYALLVEGKIRARLRDFERARQAFATIMDDSTADASLKWEAQHETALVSEESRPPDQAEQHYRAAIDTFEAARASVQLEDSRLPFLNNANRLYDDYIHFLVQQGKVEEALRIADYSRAQALAEGLDLVPHTGGPKPSAALVHPQQVSRQTNSTLLFYWLGSKRSYLWSVTPTGVTLAQIPRAADIDAIAQRYRKALVSPRDAIESANPDGMKLFEMLVAPASASIANNSRVIVFPDGSLNSLNFETLIVPGPNPHYWIEDVTVNQSTSLRLLSARYARTHSGDKLLLIGDPVSPNPEYGELPKAALEMEGISRHFPSSAQTDYSRGRATANAYLSSKPEQFSYIHFVAHGTASRLSPLDSAVVLSPDGTKRDSFKLYAREIIQHPLKARLVTISTCYGAGARSYAGEGLVGLSWAFLRAGAEHVVGALWEVSDSSTPQLMNDFYGGLQNGKSPQDALRSAKLSLLHSDTVFRKPFYWAPFQLYVGRGER